MSYTWTYGHITVTLSPARYYGRQFCNYTLRSGDEVIFESDDYGVSPLHAWDSVDSVMALLGFLTLKPGDTDPDYFDDYTQRQLDWADSHEAEALQLKVYDHEIGVEVT